jgi:hypothetical protein
MLHIKEQASQTQKAAPNQVKEEDGQMVVFFLTAEKNSMKQTRIPQKKYLAGR